MRYRKHSGRALVTATSTALILTLSACGGDSGGGSAADDLPEEGATVEPSEFVDDMLAGLEASTTAQMTMNVDAAGTTLEASGEVDYTSDPAALQFTSTNPLGEGELEIVLVDGVMYLNQGSMTNDKFLAYDLSDTENLPPGLDQLENQMNPLAAFEEFEPALNEVTFEGEDEIGGEELAHYVVLLDPAKMESFQGMPAGGQMPEELEYDLYFDDEFRIRQMNLTMDGEPSVDLEVTLSEWGEPVDITAPPEDQTVDPSQGMG